MEISPIRSFGAERAKAAAALAQRKAIVEELTNAGWRVIPDIGYSLARELGMVAVGVVQRVRLECKKILKGRGAEYAEANVKTVGDTSYYSPAFVQEVTEKVTAFYTR